MAAVVLYQWSMTWADPSRRWPSAFWLLCLASASAWAACTFDWDQYEPQGGASGGAATTTTGQGGEQGGTGGSGGAAGGGSPQGGSGGLGGGGAGVGTLVDDGLIARYYIDEAASGQGPSELEDAAADPLALPLTYVGFNPMTFIDEGGHRGLNWPQSGIDARACASTAGTKVETAIDGGTAATIEVVARVEGTHTEYSRLSEIGENLIPELTLRVHSLSAARFDWNASLVGVWPVDFQALGRVVLHLVLDTTRNNAANRARLYVNGATVNSMSMTPPVQGSTTTLPAGSSYCVGNREIGERSIAGTIFYAALYSEALSGSQIDQNAKVLLADDDAP